MHQIAHPRSSPVLAEQEVLRLRQPQNPAVKLTDELAHGGALARRLQRHVGGVSRALFESKSEVSQHRDNWQNGYAENN